VGVPASFSAPVAGFEVRDRFKPLFSFVFQRQSKTKKEMRFWKMETAILKNGEMVNRRQGKAVVNGGGLTNVTIASVLRHPTTAVGLGLFCWRPCVRSHVDMCA